MSDGRPKELASYIDSAAEKNDGLILDALGRLENQKTRGKLKVTVAAVCLLTGLSRNTVRNRQWALEKLKAIKKRVKSPPTDDSASPRAVEDEDSILDSLRARTRNLLKQNALLYEEILALRRTLERRDAEIAELRLRRYS